MAIDNEEQKEILLGNKQLLSVFFIVVVLLGVAFTIGYLIGKNTATVRTADNSHTAAGQADAAQGNSPSPVSTGLAEPPPVNPGETSVSEAPERRTAPPADSATHPAKPYDKPAAPVPTEQPNPAGGSYLQVAALKRQDADNIARVLRSRGYPTVLGESSKEGLFRVLVGPFKNMGDLSESKQKLRASGMESIIAR